MPLRFDPATPLEFTPPFVRWTLALGCPLRDCDDYFDPDRTERLLRGVRCYSDALTEGRVRDGIAWRKQSGDEEPRGFEIGAVLEALGGVALVQQSCGNCPANAIACVEPRALAGCVGHLIPPPGETELWLSLALHERPTTEVLNEQHQRLTHLKREKVIGLVDYVSAIETALSAELPLMVRAYPGGHCEGRRWNVEPHCDRCKAAWPEARRQQCRVCGQVGGRQAERLRMRMGTRPYRPLREFLTAEQIRSIGF